MVHQIVWVLGWEKVREVGHGRLFTLHRHSWRLHGGSLFVFVVMRSPPFLRRFFSGVWINRHHWKFGAPVELTSLRFLHLFSISFGFWKSQQHAKQVVLIQPLLLQQLSFLSQNGIWVLIRLYVYTLLQQLGRHCHFASGGQGENEFRKKTRSVQAKLASPNEKAFSQFNFARQPSSIVFDCQW